MVCVFSLGCVGLLNIGERYVYICVYICVSGGDII